MHQACQPETPVIAHGALLEARKTCVSMHSSERIAAYVIIYRVALSIDFASRVVGQIEVPSSVAFRAVGQEPGWLLEITNGEEILIVTNYGQDRVSHPYVEPQEDKAAARTVFQIDAQTSVLIEGKACTDTMSGESFDVTVTVNTGGQTLKGCGRALF